MWESWATRKKETHTSRGDNATCDAGLDARENGKSREEKKCDKVKEMNIRVTSVNAPRNLHSEKLTVLSVDVR